MKFTPEQIAYQWLEAFNGRDLKALIALYDDDAEHYSPKLKARHPESQGLIKGKAALQAWWEDAFKRLPQLYYKLTAFTANSDRVFMEYIRQVPGEQDILVAEVLEVKEKIVASRVYHG